jgi:hypothetical protein
LQIGKYSKSYFVYLPKNDRRKLMAGKRKHEDKFLQTKSNGRVTGN